MPPGEALVHDTKMLHVEKPLDTSVDPTPLTLLTASFSGDSLIVITGTCSVCQGDVRAEWATNFVTPSADSIQGQAFGGTAEWDVLVECSCGSTHGRKGMSGCGMSLMMRVARG